MSYYCPAKDCPGDHQSKRQYCPGGVYEEKSEAHTESTERSEFFRGARIRPKTKPINEDVK